MSAVVPSRFGDAATALQRAVRARLLGDAAVVAACGGRITDGPPTAGEYPYLAFASVRVRPFGGDEADGAEVTLGLDAVGRGGGRADVLALVAAVEAALAASAPGPDDMHLVALRLAGAEAERLRDGRTWRCRMTLVALVET